MSALLPSRISHVLLPSPTCDRAPYLAALSAQLTMPAAAASPEWTSMRLPHDRKKEKEEEQGTEKEEEQGTEKEVEQGTELVLSLGAQQRGQALLDTVLPLQLPVGVFDVLLPSEEEGQTKRRRGGELLERVVEAVRAGAPEGLETPVCKGVERMPWGVWEAMVQLEENGGVYTFWETAQEGEGEEKEEEVDGEGHVQQGNKKKRRTRGGGKDAEDEEDVEAKQPSQPAQPALRTYLHHYVYVLDQEESLQFYTEQLGFVKKEDVTMEIEGETFRWVTVAPPAQPDDFTLALVPITPGFGISEELSTALDTALRAKTGLPIGIAHVDDCDGAFKRLTANDVTVSAPTDEQWGRQCIAEDPQGNFLYVVCPAPTSTEEDKAADAVAKEQDIAQDNVAEADAHTASDNKSSKTATDAVAAATATTNDTDAENVANDLEA